MSLHGRAHRFITRAFQANSRTATSDSALASFTFDDFPKSAWTVGGDILAEYGASATYYVSGGFCGRTVAGTAYFDEADLTAAHAAGHEMACHTYSHIKATKVSAGDFEADIIANAQFLTKQAGLPAPRNFAYPHGALNVVAKHRFGQRFRSMRGIYWAPNGPRLDLAQLNAFGLETRSFDRRVVAAAVARAAATRSWLIFFAHDIGDDPTPYGCTPAMLRFVLDTLAEHGVAAVTVDQALDRIAPSA